MSNLSKLYTSMMCPSCNANYSSTKLLKKILPTHSTHMPAHAHLCTHVACDEVFRAILSSLNDEQLSKPTRFVSAMVLPSVLVTRKTSTQGAGSRASAWLRTPLSTFQDSMRVPAEGGTCQRYRVGNPLCLAPNSFPRLLHNRKSLEIWT